MRLRKSILRMLVMSFLLAVFFMYFLPFIWDGSFITLYIYTAIFLMASEVIARGLTRGL